jgi:hypothetical protein
MNCCRIWMVGNTDVRIWSRAAKVYSVSSLPDQVTEEDHERQAADGGIA